MTPERLLGSYLVRVVHSRHERRITVHSVLTGERRPCVDFAELAAFLETATSAATGWTHEPTDDAQGEAGEQHPTLAPRDDHRRRS